MIHLQPVPWLAPRFRSHRRGLGATPLSQTIALDGLSSKVQASPAEAGSLLTVNLPFSAIYIAERAVGGVKPAQGTVFVSGRPVQAPIDSNPEAVVLCADLGCTQLMMQVILDGAPGSMVVTWTDSNTNTGYAVTIVLPGSSTQFHPGPVHLPIPTTGPSAPPTPTPAPPQETAPNPSSAAPASTSGTTIALVVGGIGVAAALAYWMLRPRKAS